VPSEQLSSEKKEDSREKEQNVFNFYNDACFQESGACHSRKYSNMNDYEHILNNNKQCNHQKIFTTTVIDKKKNINFKVIKNKDRYQLNSNFLNSQNSHSKNDINNYENNNKNNNLNNFNEVTFGGQNKKQIETDSMIKRNADSSLRVNDERNLNLKLNHNNFLFYNKDYATFGPISNEGYKKISHDLRPFGKKKLGSNLYECKKKFKHNFNYLDILINAAEKFIQQGCASIDASNIDGCKLNEINEYSNTIEELINQQAESRTYGEELNQLLNKEGCNNVNVNVNLNQSIDINSNGTSSNFNSNLVMNTNSQVQVPTVKSSEKITRTKSSSLSHCKLFFTLFIYYV
jgi:hypothetical protein